MIKKSVKIINDFSGGQDTKTPIIGMSLNKSPNMRNFHCAGVAGRLIKRGGFDKLNSSVVESDNLDAYYPPGYQTYDYTFRYATANTQVGQGFIACTTGTCTKIRLWLKKVGSPTGNINVEIQTDSSGVPSGTAVSNGTSSNVDVSTLETTYGWIEFTFSTNPSLTAETQYHVVIQGDFTISTSNYVHWGSDDYDVIYSDGSMSVYDAVTWTADSNYDACFEVYVTNGCKGDDNFALWDFSSKNMLMGSFGTSLYKMDKDSTGTPDGTWDSIPGGSAWDSYTKLMLHCDGTDESTTFTDETGKTVTANGDAQIDTAQKVFGTASGLFDGTGDYLSLADSADWTFGTGDFTIDMWVYCHAFDADCGFISQYADADNFWGFEFTGAGGANLYFYWRVGAANAYLVSGTHGMSLNTWHHIALVRYGNVVTIYVDGTAIASQDHNYDLADIASTLNIGKTRTAGYFDGAIDELRVSKGIARWTANFTPPASAYSATSLPITSSRFWTFADWQSGRALINTDIGLYTYVGSGDASVVSGAPVGKFVIIWKNYAFIAGIRGAENTARYSNVSDYTTWDASDVLRFDTNDGDVITGIRILKGRLYVFKRYSVHRVTYLGSNPTFQVDQILGMGCPSHYSIKELDMGGEIGSVLIFPTTDKKLAIFDGYNVQIINDNLTEENNDLFATADDQPISFADMDYTYADLFHAVVKTDTYEYILYCVLNGDAEVNYAFVFDYKTGGVYPYDGMNFASNCYMMSTNKARILYCGGYSGYTYTMESGNDDDGTDINAYWVSGKIKPEAVGLLNKTLLLGINHKEVTSASTLNINFQYRIDWNVSWTTAETFSFDHNDELAFGKTSMFDIGNVSNMFQVKLQDDSSNPAPTIYSLELHGDANYLGTRVGDRATS